MFIDLFRTAPRGEDDSRFWSWQAGKWLLSHGSEIADSFRQMSKTVANLLLLVAGAVWGAGFVAQQTAMETVGPMAFIGFRFLLAGLAVLPLAIWEYRRSNRGFSRDVFRAFALVGVIFFLALASQQVGLLETTVTNAGFLTALYVILVPVILLIFARTPQPAIIWPSAVLAFAGIYLMGDGGIAGLTRGDWLVILGAVFAALQVIYTGKVVKLTELPVCMACFQFLLSGALGFVCHALLFLTPISETPISLTGIQGAWIEIVYAGLFAGATAFTLQAVAQRYTSESAAAVLLSSESLFAALLAAILIGDRLSGSGYLGCTMIFAAILIVQLVPAQTRKPAVG